MSGGMDAGMLVHSAREVLYRPHEHALGGLWPRSAAILTRQALELAVDDRLEKELGIGAGPTHRTRLLALRALHGDDELATRVSQVWASLSRASHHHAYELDPTVGELEEWIEQVDRAISALSDPQPAA